MEIKDLDSLSFTGKAKDDIEKLLYSFNELKDEIKDTTKVTEIIY